MLLRFVVLAAALGSALTAGPAVADQPTTAPATAETAEAGVNAAECGFREICLYSGRNETGTQVTVPQHVGCQQVAELGIPAARSAVSTHLWLILMPFSDANCQTPADPQFLPRGPGGANITPEALSVQLLPIPSS